MLTRAAVGGCVQPAPSRPVRPADPGAPGGEGRGVRLDLTRVAGAAGRSAAAAAARLLPDRRGLPRTGQAGAGARRRGARDPDLDRAAAEDAARRPAPFLGQEPAADV